MQPSKPFCGDSSATCFFELEGITGDVLHDHSGAHTLSATVEWFIQRLPANDKNI